MNPMPTKGLTIGAIIQARMGSTRFPGKVLRKVNGKSLLSHMISRVRLSDLIDDIIVATSMDQNDQQIVDEASLLNSKYFCGSENDVLSRYLDCAEKYNLDVIVRLTGDCPLVDPKLIDELLLYFFDNKLDYASNCNLVSCQLPDGFDVEVFSIEALRNVNKISL